jgi:hypothetical protein
MHDPYNIKNKKQINYVGGINPLWFYVAQDG